MVKGTTDLSLTGQDSQYAAPGQEIESIIPLGDALGHNITEIIKRKILTDVDVNDTVNGTVHLNGTISIVENIILEDEETGTTFHIENGKVLTGTTVEQNSGGVQSSHLYLAAVGVAAVVLVFILAVLLYKAYRKIRKHRRVFHSVSSLLHSRGSSACAAQHSNSNNSLHHHRGWFAPPPPPYDRHPSFHLHPFSAGSHGKASSSCSQYSLEMEPVTVINMFRVPGPPKPPQKPAPQGPKRSTRKTNPNMDADGELAKRDKLDPQPQHKIDDRKQVTVQIPVIHGQEQIDTGCSSSNNDSSEIMQRQRSVSF